jgi:hypothetical protein
MSDLDSDKEVAATLPTLEQARADVSKAQDSKSLDVPRRLQRKFITRFGILSVEAERSYTHLAGLKAHYIHKAIWSYFLLFLMAFMVFFQSFLLFKVGTGAWDFSKYAWLLPALLVQNLA